MTERLAIDVVERGDIRHDRWYDAVAATPRHVFVLSHFDWERCEGYEHTLWLDGPDTTTWTLP